MSLTLCVDFLGHTQRKSDHGETNEKENHRKNGHDSHNDLLLLVGQRRQGIVGDLLVIRS